MVIYLSWQKAPFLPIQRNVPNEYTEIRIYQSMK